MARETASGVNGHASHLHPISMLLLRSLADALDCQISEKSPWPPRMVTSRDRPRDEIGTRNYRRSGVWARVSGGTVHR